MGFRSSLRSMLGMRNRRSWAPSYPSWLNPEFESRLSLRDRWEAGVRIDAAAYPRREKSFESLSHPMWPLHFEDQDPATTGSAVEFRYPFFDTRVVDFLLNIPSLPWCFDKG